MAGGRLLQLWQLPICDGGVAGDPYEKIWGGKCGSVTELSPENSAFPYQFLFHQFSKLVYRQTPRDLSSAPGLSIEKCMTTGFREGFCTLNTVPGMRVCDRFADIIKSSFPWAC